MLEEKVQYEEGKNNILSALSSLKKVSERVGAPKFSSEIDTFEKEILSFSFLDKQNFSNLSPKVEAWKEKYYSEFTTIQDISEFQCM